MEEKNPIELSVIIPCWNVAPWLPRCLEEVFIALPPKSEVIAVDDGSEDETLEILLEFSSKHPELKVLSQKNSGVSAARNRALDVSQGEYIFFVDPDDGVEPEFFTLMINRMKEKEADYCVVAFKERSGGNDGTDWDENPDGFVRLCNANEVDEFLKKVLSKTVSGTECKVNKTLYAVLTILFGFIGINKFYAGKIKQGILCLIFSWTLIPLVLSVAEFIVVLTRKADKQGKININTEIISRVKFITSLVIFILFVSFVNTTIFKSS